MTTSRTRTTLWSVAAGLLATAAIAFTPSLAASPAGASDDKPACGKQSPGGSSDKKCPSPTPSPTATTPQGNETGCRDVTFAYGSYALLTPTAASSLLPPTGSTLQFTFFVGDTQSLTPTCPEVTYTVIARNATTLAEVGRQVQPGNGTTPSLTSAFNFPTYNEPCIAVDVIVSEGDVVHDRAPDSRSSERAGNEDLCDGGGTGGQTWN